MTKRILILGVGGMLGHACFDYFTKLDQFGTFGTWRKPTLDKIRNFDASKDSIEEVIKNIQPDWIINCIGVIKQKIDENDQTSVEKTLRINQIYPHQIANAVAGSITKVIQIATDCVFNGIKGDYSEESPHDAVDLYGKSKSYLRKLLARLRNIKRKYPDTYQVEGTRAHGLYINTISRFRETWKQVDNLKKEVIKKYQIWDNKKIAKLATSSASPHLPAGILEIVHSYNFLLFFLNF